MDSWGPVVLGKLFSFVIPRNPSKKNSKIVAGGRRRADIPDGKTRKFAALIGKRAKAAACRAGWIHNGEPLILTVEWEPVRDEVYVTVAKVFKIASPRRFDLQNLPEGIADALESYRIIANDKDFLRILTQEMDLSASQRSASGRPPSRF